MSYDYLQTLGALLSNPQVFVRQMEIKDMVLIALLTELNLHHVQKVITNNDPDEAKKTCIQISQTVGDLKKAPKKCIQLEREKEALSQQLLTVTQEKEALSQQLLTVTQEKEALSQQPQGDSEELIQAKLENQQLSTALVSLKQQIVIMKKRLAASSVCKPPPSLQEVRESSLSIDARLQNLNM